MTPYPPPAKPFDSYRWRWASLTPSEGLNKSEVFLGVLRALYDHQGEAKGSAPLLADLERVRLETGTRVDLARTGDRNLLRNSGQYWQSLGLLDGEQPSIALTPLGQQVARAEVTKEEFATAIVRTLVLPNPALEDAATIDAWATAGLTIRPLVLILQLMAECGRQLGPENAYLTREELVRILIPLAGSKAPLQDVVRVIDDFRSGRTTLAGWPDCAPGANDPRMAAEFLSFLATYGFCVEEDRGANYSCHLGVAPDEVEAIVGAGPPGTLTTSTSATVIAAVRASRGSEPVERNRVLTSVLARPGQSRFRRDLLAAYAGRCLLTGESFESALQAAHIRSVTDGGPDDIANGVLLRSDVHALYDSAHILVSPAGLLSYSDALVGAATSSYLALPASIAWPGFVNLDFVMWRNHYT